MTLSSRTLLSFLLAILANGALATALVQAQEAAHPDPVVQQAADSLAEVEAEYHSMRPGDHATATRLMERVRPIGAQLGSVEDKNHPAWIAAATKYNELNKGIPARYQAGAAANPDHEISGLASALAVYEKKLAEMAPGDTATGVKYLDELKAAANQIRAVKNKAHPAYSALTQQYNELNNAIADKANDRSSGGPPVATPPPPAAPFTGKPLTSWQTTKANQLSRNISSTLSRIREAPDPEVLTEEFQSRIRSSAETYVSQLTKIDRMDNPEVAALGPKITQISQDLNARVADASQSLSSLGNYEERLAQIKAAYSSEPTPDPLQMPFTEEASQEYVARVKELREGMVDDLQYLQSLSASSFAPSDLSSRIHWQNQRLQNLDQSMNASKQAMRDMAWSTMDQVNTIASGDADKQMTNEETYAWRSKFLGESKQNFEGAVAFYESLGDTAMAKETKAKLAMVEAEIPRLESRFAEAIADVRMPESASGSQELIETATKVLTSGKYEVNPIKAIVINSDKVRRNKEEGDISASGNYATVTVYKYDWEEFQVATAEKVGDRYYLFYNTIKYFHSGGSRTPLNRWLLSGRFQGSQILEKNIR